MTKQTTTQKPEITSAAIYRVTDKATQEVYYLVNSDSEDTSYEVRWNKAACEWQCKCPSYKPCKHERAVNQVERIRYEQQKEASQKEASPVALEPVATAAAEDRKVAKTAPRQAEDWSDISEPLSSEPRRNLAPLNGERGFSLYR